MNKVLKSILVVGSLSLLGAACVKGADTNVNVAQNTNVSLNTNLAVNTNVSANLNAAVNTNSVANTNTSTVDTSDWQTYTNVDYEFSFKYPKTYFVNISKSTKADFIDDTGVVFMIGRKITDSQIDPVRITLFDHIVGHPSADEINSVAFAEGPNKIGESFDHVISESSYSINQYSGKMFRVKDLTGSYPVDEDHKLKDVAAYYYLDSNSKTVEIRLTDEAATGVDANGLLNSLQF